MAPLLCSKIHQLVAGRATRLVTLAAPVTTHHLRVVLTQARARPYLSTFELHRTAGPTA